MTSAQDRVTIGSFARVFGDRERTPDDIPDFEALWRAESPDTDFGAMGCGTFRTMTKPVAAYAAAALRQTLREHDVPPGAVGHVLFAASDAVLRTLGGDFVVEVLTATGLTESVPVLISGRQCCSSLAALAHGRQLFTDPETTDVAVVSLDATPDDRARVRSFALFSDAVASCLLSRERPGEVRLLGSAARTDPAGLIGEDSFVSRQRVARAALTKALRDSGRELGDITKVFPTNLYQPVTQFSAMAAGIDREKLHFTETLRAYGHCGNSDWLINLADYRQRTGLRPGETYLAHASAPGFSASAVLAGV
ncbi:hypothetical protein ADL22_21950 [Streptomyces sp. NRRL F-4489]|uniref:3-oxoacyl-[acyl-carrier-protein] synthase III C-terminal domain-containing protein n=1 Tax=Streptomyces sp. NRRL F-4489 TaxID=1609095 RepID=UPI00074AA735|nr:3-oxoacyl-[acyl-carrier-protein] synthase III C-terminal domain-containing protein [Streptomyces sp. NRRL F-4489]KUL37335.1 hypothetical protein ADL22_21950 [Streptomyces sp. NRRL F-4489]